MSEVIRRRFTARTLNEEQIILVEYVRNRFIDLAERLEQTLPESRARSIALTELESACMWTIKAIAHDAPEAEST